MEKEYYICSPEVIWAMNPEEVSKPVWMYTGHKNVQSCVHIAVLDFSKVEEEYNSLEENSEQKAMFWCQEIVPGTMNIDSISLEDFEENDPWSVIEEKLNLTNMNNRAMTICNICDREGLNYIDFWNKMGEIWK